jgi:uncharacterized protein
MTLMQQAVRKGILTTGVARGLASLGLIATIWLLMAGQPGAAASFDCKKAAQPLEKVICGDPELSKLDEDLTASYGRAKAALSPDGQKILQTGQRDWLAFSRRICKTRLDKKIAKIVDQSPADCLKSEYRERIEDLDDAAIQHEGFTIGTVDTYELTDANPNEPGGRPGFSYRRVSWPRIDHAPAGIDVASWNKVIEAAAKKLATEDDAQGAGDSAAPASPDANSGSGDAGSGDTGASNVQNYGEDIDVAYNLGLVTPQLISVELTYSVYGHGAAHPGGTSQVHSLFLVGGRELTEKDLFRGDQDWLAYMTKRSHDEWVKIMEDAADSIDDKAIADVIKDPSCWLLTDKGLSVTFPLYSVGPYVVGEQQVDFTWEELKPYLVEKLPFTRS